MHSLHRRLGESDHGMEDEQSGLEIADAMRHKKSLYSFALSASKSM
jgi:hypothetical protein